MSSHKAVQVLLHPRVGAGFETIYAAHGLHSADGWFVGAIYAGLFLIALAHLIWAHMEVAA